MMRICTVLIPALFSLHSGYYVLSQREELQPKHDEDISTTETYEYSTQNATSSEVLFSTTPAQKNYLDNVSIQDVLSSKINSSEKIEKKIIDYISQYASNCDTYKKIDLSTEGFTFPQTSITIDLGSANAIFYNIRISELSQNSSKPKSYSTSIECDSTRMPKVEVKLLNELEIFADLKVTKIRNSSRGFQSRVDILDTGSMCLTLKNNSISKLFYTQTNQENGTTSRMIYSKSVISLKIAKKFQMPIHNKVKTFFDAVEPPLGDFLGKKFDEELRKNNISLADSCSNFISTESYFNNNTNNFYVISRPNSPIFEGISLNSNPILIDGLLSFDNTEFIVLGNEVLGPDNSDNYYSTTPSSDDILEMEEKIVKIKTNELKGKVDWSYDSEQKTIFFTLEFIQFEVKVNNTHQHDETELYNGNDSNPSESYTGSNKNETEVNLYLGNIQIDSSKSCTCENESEFVNFVLSEYLKIVIADSLKNSLHKRIQNESLLANCA